MWPRNAKAAVCLTGDVDDPRDLSGGRLAKVFEVLDDYGIRYTFPITVLPFLEHCDVVHEIVDHGDEVAGHGDFHVGFRGQSYEVQKKRLAKMVNALRGVFGLKVEGFRAPYLSEDFTTIRAASDLGLLYDSTITYGGTWCWRIGEWLTLKTRCRVTDLLAKCSQSNATPHLLRKLDRIRFFARRRLKMDGPPDDLPLALAVGEKERNIVGIPVSLTDDYHLIETGPRYRSWKKVASVWVREFNYHYENGGLFVLLAHPLRIGEGKFVGALRSLVEHISAKDDVWFATLSELARWWRDRQQSN